ncbi:MAG: hypothetical protein ACPGU4_13540 [Flavobacteriales bacterium]
MQFGKLLLLLTVLVMVVFLDACEKEDSIPPRVTFIEPNQGRLFNVLDTVVARFSVEEESRLEFVSANIVDASFVPIGPSTSVNFSEINFTASAEIVLENKLLETGDYHVLITASDGVNETREFREIRIVAIPKKRRAVYFSSASPSNQIWKLDSILQSGVQWLNPNQDIKQLCVNSLNDRLTFLGQFSTGINSIDLATNGVVWSDNTANVNQIPRYTTLYCFSNTVYVGLYDKELRSYNLNGTRTLSELTGNYRPESVYADDTYLVVEMQLIGDGSHHMFVYQRVTNVLLWQVEVPMNVESICQLQTDEVLLFGNENGEAKVLHYDIGSNGWWEPRSLPSGMLRDAVETDAGKFAIAHESGLYSYTYNPNFLNMLTADNYQDIVFDVDNNSIVGASRNVLNEVSLINGATINSFTQADSITSLDIHYTR